LCKSPLIGFDFFEVLDLEDFDDLEDAEEPFEEEEVIDSTSLSLPTSEEEDDEKDFATSLVSADPSIASAGSCATTSGSSGRRIDSSTFSVSFSSFRSASIEIGCVCMERRLALVVI
jgi:hypothetical protein